MGQGTKYLANCSQADASACISKINDLTDEADNLAYGSYGSFAAVGAFWLWGIIDAAIYGEDYSQAIYGE